MKVNYSFVCDGANIAQSGNLNVLGIFKSINSTVFPCTHPKFTYISHIEFHRSEVGKHGFKMTFVDDDGKEILPSINGEIDVNPQAPWTNIIVELCNVSFQKPGAYQIDLTVDNQHVSTDTVRVMQVAAQA